MDPFRTKAVSALTLRMPLVILIPLILALWACDRRETRRPHRGGADAKESAVAGDVSPVDPGPVDPRSGDARSGDARSGDTRQSKAMPRHILRPFKDLVESSERFSFLMFGDSRQNFSLCDPKRTQGRPCPLRRAQGSDAQGLCDEAPKHIYDEVVAALGRRGMGSKAKGAIAASPTDDFVLFTGDLVYRGSCAKDWAHIKAALLDRLPPGRFFPAIGNHDVWHRVGEPDSVPQFFAAFPSLGEGEGKARRNWAYYAFRVGATLMVTLDTGGYPQEGGTEAYLKADRRFLSSLASFEEQMGWLEEVLRWAGETGVKHLVVQYHKPSFTSSIGHPPLDEDQDPMGRLRTFKARHPGVNVLVVVGHNHTTEVHLSGGVLHLVAGGGGARQYLRTQDWGKPTQPAERFWAGSSRQLRYNLFRILVEGEQIHIQERCLAWQNGRVVVEDGSRISPDGKVTHRSGACEL